MYVKKLIFPFAACISMNSVWSQQVVDNICMQVIGSNGLSVEKLGKKYDATLGEVMTATLVAADGSYTVTQGFHQPECALTPVNTTDLAVQWQLEVFPNPASTWLHIRYDHPESITLETRVWSITGALVSNWKAMPSLATLDCSTYAPGLYLMEVKDPKSGQKTILRFIKTSL